MRWLLIPLLIGLVGCAGTSTPPTKAPPFSLDAPSSRELLNGSTIQQDVAVNWEVGEREDLDIVVTVDPDGKGVSGRAMPARLERGVGPIQVAISASGFSCPSTILVCSAE